ncbi:retrovirus-related pol polyprotein from transposon TNT 1-94 [Tanacetum coccineum]
MSGTIPPIPPPSGNTGNLNPNRVDTIPYDTVNTTTTTNVAQTVVDENLPQLLDSRGGSHVTNLPEFDKENFTSWKVRFLVFLDGLEPYLLKTLEDGSFIPMSSLSTYDNPLPKCQNQWSNAESRLANQDKRLKSIIKSFLLNDVMKSVIKCKIAKETWNDLILTHEGPFHTSDTKIAALRLKFNDFKSLEGEKVNGTFTRLKCLLNDLENNSVIIPQAKVNATFVNSLPRKWLSMNQTQRANNSIKMIAGLLYSDSDVEEDQRTINEFMADLNAEYHERALLANQKRFYKRSRRKGKNEKGKSDKGLIAESFDWDEESVSSKYEGTTKIKAFIAIAEDEPSVGKADARSGQWVEITMKKTCSKVTLDQLLSEQVPGNIVKALGGRGRRKEKIASKEVIFTKADESSSMSIPEITSESECETKEPLPPLPKMIGAEPAGTSNILISLADLTLNMADLTLSTFVPKKTKPTSDKVSPTHAIKKKTKTKSSTVPALISEKKGKASTENLLLTLMKEIKSLKEQIKVPSNNSPSVSQTRSSKSSKGKQTTWFGPCKHCGFKNHLAKDCYLKPKCSTCGSTDHLTKEHPEQTAVKRTLTMLKAQSSVNPLAKKDSMIPKPFKDCKYYGFNDHHCDNCELGVRYVDYLNRSSKESGPKVVFGDNTSGDTEGYDLVNYNGITFTRVAYVNGLKHNLISISQLCDANFKFLFTKTQGTIFNQNDEVVLIAPRKIDIYVIDMSSYNSEITCEKGKHYRASFKTKRSFSINKCLHLLHMDLFGHVKPQTISHNKYTLVIVDEYSRKIENLNEVRVKELRSENGTEFRNHKLEEFCDEKGISQNFSSPYTPEQKVSIIVKRHGKTAYDVFRGKSPDISYFYVFRCLVHIHNHRDHLGKFNEKADDGFFLGYSPVAKAFRVFNIRRQEMEETYHVTFNDEFFEPMNKVTQCSGNIKYFPYIPAYETITENNSTPTNSIPQDSVSPEEPPEFTSADDHPTLSELDYLESAKIPDFVINEPISEVQPSPTTISPSADVTLLPPVPQDRCSRENHIELVNIIGEHMAGITTRSRIRDSEAALAHECLYEGIDYEETFAHVARLEAIRIFLAYAAYMGFMVNHMDVKSAFLNGKITEDVYVQQPPGFKSSEFPNHVCKLDKALYGLKQAPRAWYETLLKFLIQHKFVRDLLKKYDLADSASVKCPMLPLNNLGLDKSGVFVNETLFRGMIGSLMYLTASRPDIQFSTCLCARYQANPKESHLVAVKRIFMYLKGTPNLGLWYPKGLGFDLKSYSDLDYAGSEADNVAAAGCCAQVL